MDENSISRRPQRVVIVGGGIAGWTAAAALGRALPGGRYSIVLVDTDGPDDSIGGFGPAEPMLPASRECHLRFSPDEDALLCAAGGTFGLGVAYSGWGSEGPAYFAPFGDVGAPIDAVPFRHLAARLRHEGRNVRLADYSLAAIAAQISRFARPLEDSRSVLSTYSYGLHLSRSDCSAFWRKQAEQAGVTCTGVRFAGAELGAAGEIAAVRLDSGARVAGDLFLDCSGSRALLIDGALGTGFESWREWLPCDRALELACESGAPPAPYVHVAAHPAGWRRTVPIQDGIGECFVYHSADLEDQHAHDQLHAGLLGRPLSAPRMTQFEAGRRRLAWNRNCIALGAAATTLEPLACTGLHLVLTAVQRLVEFFPHDPDGPAEASEYNRLTVNEHERLRDFLILRYKANGRRGQAFWDRCRHTEVPDSLARKIDLYRSRGRVLLYDEETFEEGEWSSLFDELGIEPRRHDALADAVPAERIDRHLKRLREIILAAAAGLPAHGDYVRALCRSAEGRR